MVADGCQRAGACLGAGRERRHHGPLGRQQHEQSDAGGAGDHGKPGRGRQPAAGGADGEDSGQRDGDDTDWLDDGQWGEAEGARVQARAEPGEPEAGQPARCPQHAQPARQPKAVRAGRGTDGGLLQPCGDGEAQRADDGQGNCQPGHGDSPLLQTCSN
jgi:hypothetical protein